MRADACASRTTIGITRMVVALNSHMATDVLQIVCHSNINAIMIIPICIVT